MVDVVSPALHVEQLNDDKVWQALRRALDYLGEHDGRCTTFISTRRARERGFDLSERLAWIAGHGHEIAMHTHFRQPDGTGLSRAERKSLPPTGDDVVASLEADYGYLVNRGHTPRGFCAGTWLVHPAATDWLASHAFEYDTSARSYGSNVGCGAATEPRAAHEVLQVPTTAPLREMALTLPGRPFPSLAYSDLTYTLFYLHDYDLVRTPKALAWRLVVRRVGRASVVPVRDAARLVRAAPPNSG